MAWAKNGTPNTLSSAGDVLTISNLTAQKFNQFLIHPIASTFNLNQNITFNNNTNSVYAKRQSDNGGTDATAVSSANISTDININTPYWQVLYVCSISGEEKLVIGFTCDQRASGATSAPERREYVAKFVPSPDATITRIDVNNSSTGDYGVDSNLSALGTD